MPQAITGIILKRMASKHRISLSRVAVGFENGLLAESYPDEDELRSHLQLSVMSIGIPLDLFTFLYSK